VDSLEALDDAAQAWFRAEPGSPDPFREVARLYQRALGEEEALAVLQEGRNRLGEPDVLALETGDLLALRGDGPGAVAEWSRAVRSPEADLGLVLRRLDGLPGDAETLAGPLLDALSASPTTVERRLAAVSVALELGLPGRALEVARLGTAALSRDDRRSFLAEVSRRAGEAGAPEVAVWALQEERSLVPERDRATLDMRLAAVAIQAGDTATAVAARTRLTRALPAGSAERRRVMAELIRVEAATAPRETLEDRLGVFRREYPDAPEADELQAAVAAGLAGRGDVQGARAIVGEGAGPLTALEGGYLGLQEGDVDAGKAALEAALPGLSPSCATEVLHLLAFLERTGSAAAQALGRSAASAHHGNAAEGLGDLVAALPAIPDEDRAPVMAWAGELALQAGETGQAEGVLQGLVDGYPDSREYPDAALSLARLRIADGDLDGARLVLERLILARPQSPVVPAARRELQRIRSGDPRPGAGR
jgi:tetratricopeptide (TPR) repeat protein